MTRGVRSPTQNRSVGVDPSHQNSSAPRRKQQTVRAGHWTEIRAKSRIYVQQLRPARGASSCGEEQEHTRTYRDPVLAAGRVVHLAVSHSHTLAAILGGRVPAEHATRITLVSKNTTWTAPPGIRTTAAGCRHRTGVNCTMPCARALEKEHERRRRYTTARTTERPARKGHPTFFLAV